jgi:prophage antirepressor-like protein
LIKRAGFTKFKENFSKPGEVGAAPPKSRAYFLIPIKMKTEIVNFDYETSLIRTLTDENEQTWFVAKDVCKILDLENVSRAIDKLDEDEKLTLKLVMSGQQRDTWITNESGFYHLVLTSTKPEAKAFRKWVTSIVLPSIRKAGKHTPEQAQTKELELQRLNNEIEEIEGHINDYKSTIKTWNEEKERKYAELRQVIRTNPNQLRLPLD